MANEQALPMPPLGEHVRSVAQNLRGPVPKCVVLYDEAFTLALSQERYDRDFPSLRMFILSLASLRASIITSLTGATPQAIPQLRHALECAMYGYLFWADDTYYPIWNNREKDKRSLATAREKFAFGAIMREISHRDSKLSEMIRSLYEGCIAIGAHPNVGQVVPTTEYFFADGAEDGVAKVNILFSERERRTSYVWTCFTFQASIRLFERVWSDEFHSLGLETNMRDALYELKQFRDLAVRQGKR